MFETSNLPELARIVQSVITPDVVAQGKMWKLTADQRHKIRVAMFGRVKPDGCFADMSATEQRELMDQFTSKVVGPIIELLPPQTSAWAVLVLYDELVDAVVIEPAQEADVGGGD